MSLIEDDDGDVFVYNDTPEDSVKLKDLSIGDHFIFRGEHFIKTRNDGWFLGISNIQLVGTKEPSHLDPTTQVELIH